ncbi:3-phosphoshikimate 1-carboxyvinyltransferase [Sulfuracidifex tepidarius]|uniref:3-phosphoshikimate 1-carboxyvinyltransferase n=1 Tax=Sulfuracidifex tepidarius TaxID=1294262 RepID=A0A510E4K7_9CREN|nr:3-phosphoshikimate 1-carboxyvinyltransferase [Sulfuracidifex tepidarius]BBG27010.1 3-phosphoshikimate 1-carboxyvinyltransferase [Sulfuracidifex tepidarius]
MKAIIERSRVQGETNAPPSKSQSIRLIFASLKTPIELIELPQSDDIMDAIDAVTLLGVRRERKKRERLLPPEKMELKDNFIKFRGSATTLRFFIPIVASIGGKITIDADPPLKYRPIRRIVESLSDKGVRFSSSTLPTEIEGKLSVDEVEISGDESSQYISGLIYGMLLRGGGKIKVKPPTSSLSYIKMTISLMNRLGAKAEMKGNVIEVNESGELSPFVGKVPGDYALSSFLAAASIISGGTLVVHDLDRPEEYFGDHSIVNLFRDMGAESRWMNNTWEVKSGEIRGITVDVNDAPDLAVSISTLAMASDKETIITGVERLKIKESDRIKTITDTVSAFGGEADYENNKLVIRGGKIKRGKISCPSDHRIAMMAAALSSVDGGEIDDACCVNKSNPKFWEQYSSIGGKVRIVNG